MEMHRSDLGSRSVNHVDVQGLGLVDVGSAIRGHIQDHLLLDLPDRLIQLLHVVRQLQLLHAAILGNQLRSQVLVPQTCSDQILQQMAIHLNELSREYSAHVEVLRVGLKGFIVAQDLRSGCCRHRSHQQGISDATLGNLRFELGPIPSTTLWLNFPHVKLQLSLRYGATLVGLIWPLQLRQFTGRFASREVDGLENVLVQLLCFVTLKGQLHHHEGIS
mmetsp:Transcript_49808/g.61157  ORF Transcript_49808/g.61157 Transcript_49808/m.61157 type:complete len:219 (-) Transcript_49808:119-775(-)